MTRGFWMLTLALFAVCICTTLVTLMLWTGQADQPVLLLASATGSLAAYILWRESKRDIVAVLMFCLALLSTLALLILIYLFNAESPGFAPKLLGALSVVGCIGLAAKWVRLQRAPASPDFPNVLLGHFDKQEIFEVAGVQFAARMAKGIQAEPHKISVALQNCYDGARRVVLKLDGEVHTKYMRFHPKHELNLGPAEVASVTLPVVTPTYPGKYHLYYSISVSGHRGKRIRLWRARSPEPRVTSQRRGALLILGVVAWGGGLRFTVGPLQEDIWAKELPHPVEEILWKPRLGTVPLN